MTWTIVGGVVGGGGGVSPVAVDDWAVGWLRPRDAMMPNIVDALMPAARVRAAAARWRRRAGRTRLPPAPAGAAVLAGALVLGAIPLALPVELGGVPAGGVAADAGPLAEALPLADAAPAEVALVADAGPLADVALAEARRAWSWRMRSARSSSVTDLPGAPRWSRWA